MTVTVVVTTPPGYAVERAYVIQVVFSKMLGLSCQHEVGSTDGEVHIRLSDSDKTIVMPDDFFQTPESAWLTRDSLPSLPLDHLDVGDVGLEAKVVEQELPVLYGEPSPVLEVTADRIRIPIDVLGSAFFMLSRYEEYVVRVRDEHGRFPSTASIAGQADIVTRPIVDEYVEVLWAAMKVLWTGLTRKERVFSQIVSCDVDLPFDPGTRNVRGIARRVGGDLLKRRSLISALRSSRQFLDIQRLGVEMDPYWTFDWMMDRCEHTGSECAFYFLTDARTPEDGTCYWGDPAIDRLMEQVHDRGHEVGLHTSYSTVDDAEQTRREYRRLRRRCRDLAIDQDVWGGRQHYLRWRPGVTWKHWAAAGLDYDSTVGFADRPGFRCGTSVPFPVFSVPDRSQLSLTERPLIVMECSVFEERYLGLGWDEGLRHLRDLKEACRRVRGDFTLLWHNSYLEEEEPRRVFESILG